MRIHHIGIVTKDINKSIILYSKLHYKMFTPIITDDNQCNRVVFLKSEDGTQTIELVEPIHEKSTVINTKEGYHHLCFEAEQAEDVMSMFRNMKIGKIFTKPMIAPALGNRAIVFACLQNGTLIEFILNGENAV